MTITEALLLIIAGLATLSFLIWLDNRKYGTKLNYFERRLVKDILIMNRTAHEPCAVCLIKYKQEITLSLDPNSRGDFYCSLCKTEYEVDYSLKIPQIKTFRLKNEEV